MRCVSDPRGLRGQGAWGRRRSERRAAGHTRGGRTTVRGATRLQARTSAWVTPRSFYPFVRPIDLAT